MELPMKTLKRCLIIALLVSIFPVYSADVTKVGITAAPFLEIGIGARAIGMGGAFVGTADDATALYWNPAGISRIDRIQAVFAHTQWIADLNFNFAGFSFPLGQFGNLGAFITSMDYGDMQVRTVQAPEGTGELFSASDMAIGLSYSRALTDRFTIGFNAKYIYQNIWHETARGFAMDIGTLFVTGLKGLRIGATLSNFGTDLRMQGKDVLVFHDINPYIIGNNDRIPANLKTESWPLPLNFQFGLAMDVIHTNMTKITLALDAVHPSDNTESVNVGGEYAFRNLFFLRLGYRDLWLQDGEQGMTFGAGFASHFIGNLSLYLDYAYADFGRLDYVQHLSMQILF